MTKSRRKPKNQLKKKKKKNNILTVRFVTAPKHSSQQSAQLCHMIMICFHTLNDNLSKLFDTLLVFLKDFYEKVNFEKKSRMITKSTQNYPAGKE